MKDTSNNQVETLIEIALEKLPKHEISEALEKLLEASKLDVKNVQVLNLIANCYYILGEFKRAESTWQKVMQVEPGNKIAAAKMRSFNSPSFQFWRKRYQESIRYIENKDYQTAKEMLHALMQENDGFVSLYQLLGLCYLALADENGARKIWRQGLSLDKNNPKLISFLSNEMRSPLSDSKEIPEKNAGLAELKNETIKAFPKRGKLIWAASGAVCLLLAVQVIIGFNSSKSSDESIQQMQSEIKYLTEKLEKQDQNLDKDELIPASAKLYNKNENENGMEGAAYDTTKEEEYYKQGYKAYLEGDWKTARNNLSVVVAMATHSYLNREALYYLARTFYLQGDLAQAKEYYLQYLKDFPNTNYTDDSLYYLGCIYYKEGNVQQARDTFIILREIDPSSGYTSTSLFQEVVK